MRLNNMKTCFVLSGRTVSTDEIVKSVNEMLLENPYTRVKGIATFLGRPFNYF